MRERCDFRFMIREFLVKTLLLGLVIVCTEANYRQGSNYYTIHVDDHGSERICKLKQCEKGEYGQICSVEDPNSTKCLPCPDGKFNSFRTKTDSRRTCVIRRKCFDDKYTYKEGNASENTICRCNFKQGFYAQDAKNLDSPRNKCNYKECPAGTQLNELGKCEQCPEKSFKKENGTSRCIKHRECRLSDGLLLVSNGTSTEDATCIHLSEELKQRRNISVAAVVCSSSETSYELYIWRAIGSICIVLLILLTVYIIKSKLQTRNLEFTLWKKCQKRMFDLCKASEEGRLSNDTDKGNEQTDPILHPSVETNTSQLCAEVSGEQTEPTATFTGEANKPQLYSATNEHTIPDFTVILEENEEKQPLQSENTVPKLCAKAKGDTYHINATMVSIGNNPVNTNKMLHTAEESNEDSYEVVRT